MGAAYVLVLAAWAAQSPTVDERARGRAGAPDRGHRRGPVRRRDRPRRHRDRRDRRGGRRAARLRRVAARRPARLARPRRCVRAEPSRRRRWRWPSSRRSTPRGAVGHGARPAALRRRLVRARRPAPHGAGARDGRARPGRRLGARCPRLGGVPGGASVAVARVAASPGSGSRVRLDHRDARGRWRRCWSWASSRPCRRPAPGGRPTSARTSSSSRPTRCAPTASTPHGAAPRRPSPPAARASIARTSRCRAPSPRGSRCSRAATPTTTASARCSRAGRSGRRTSTPCRERLARAGYATGVVSDYAGDIFSRIDLGFGMVDVPAFDFRQLVRQRALERETPLLPVLHSRLGRAAFPVMREMNDAADPIDARARRHPGDAPAAGARARSSSSSSSRPRTSPTPPRRRTTAASPTPRTGAASSTTSPSASAARGPGRRPRRDAGPRALRRRGRAPSTTRRRASSTHCRRLIGLAGNTIVVVTADHGETLYDNGHGAGHGDHLFGDEGTHVPLVVVDPRMQTPGAGARDCARRRPRADALRARRRRRRRRTSTAGRSRPP